MIVLGSIDNQFKMRRLHKKRAGKFQRNQTESWYESKWSIITGVAVAAFTLGLNGPALLQNIRQMPNEVTVTKSQYTSWLKDDEKWQGDWSGYPEYVVNVSDMHLSEDVDARLTIFAKEGELGGMIATGKICQNVPFNFLMIRGKVSGNKSQVEVWDYLGGKDKVFATLELVRGDDVITINPISGATDWFPKAARIGKHPEVNGEFLTNYCADQRKQS